MSRLPRPIRLLRGATLADGRAVDVELDGAVVGSVGPATGATPAASAAAATEDDELDLTGYLLLAAPAEPHAHLDKALSFDAIRPAPGDLEAAIASWRVYAAAMTVDDIADRARRQALAMLANGTTAIRSHIDVLLGPAPMRCVDALVRVRDELAGLMDIELVALASWELPDAVLERALDAGVDLVGGAPHLAPDPLADLHRLLDLAERRGVGVDLHTDESLDGPDTLEHFARRAGSWRVGRSAGHCVRLGSMPAEQRDAVIEAARIAGVGIIANPITNLYLQGWRDEVGPRRGLTAARQLVDAGVRFAAGADNVRDPFNPLGRGDAFETAMLLVTAAHLTVDEAWHAVADGARDVLDLPAAGPVPGAAAELLAIRADSLPDAVATASADRYVLHRGALVAETHVSREIAAPAHLLERIPG